jgi:hypothetical protein
MSLPLLVSGADCGPINPLQNLGKRFDQDRGVQQVCFCAGRVRVSLLSAWLRTTLEQDALAHLET